MKYTETAVGKISKFTLGTVQLGMHYGMANTSGQPSKVQAFDILDEAAKAGVNSLDTSVDYGTSEEVIGEYRKERDASFFITSKFRVGGDKPEADLVREAELSVNRLQKIDMFFFHSGEEMVAHADRLEEPMKRLMESGMIRFPGASVYEVEEIQEFLRYDWMKGIQVPMNILDGRIIESGLLEELSKRGVTVFVRSVFLQGLLCMDKSPERYAFLDPYIEELREVAREEKLSLKELSVAYIRDLPGVSALVLGCETVQQVRENARLLETKSLSEQGMSAIRQIAKRVPIEEAMDRIQGKK